MNEILAKLEEMNLNDLTDIFIYLTDLINYKKRTAAEAERLALSKAEMPFNARNKREQERSRKRQNGS